MNVIRNYFFFNFLIGNTMSQIVFEDLSHM